MTDLVKRLRAWADLMANVELLDLFDAAAPGRFAQLDAQEVARGLREAADYIEKLEARAEAAEASNLRMAEALRDCVDSLEYVNSLPEKHRYASPIVGYGVRDQRIAKARAALAASPPKAQEKT